MNTVKYTVIWIILYSLVVFSCTKDNPAFNRENIKAIWVLDTRDGSLIPEKEYMVYEFGTTSLSMRGVKNLGEGNYKWGSGSVSYGVLCRDLKIWGTVVGFNDDPAAIRIEQEYELIEHKDSSLTISPTLFKINDTDVIPDYTQATMRKISSTDGSADSLKGIWEVNSIGEDIINTFRLEFLEEGGLNFYLKQPNGTWALLDADSDDYYDSYDKLLAITLYDNNLLGTKDKWGVAIFNIVSISPFSKKMILSKDSEEYSFIMIEGQEEGGDEAL